MSRPIKECWYALTLAILAPKPLYPENAFIGIDTGKIPRNKLDVIAPDMIAVHSLGDDSWAKIGELFGLSGENAMSIVSRWERKHRKLEEAKAL